MLICYFISLIMSSGKSIFSPFSLGMFLRNRIGTIICSFANGNRFALRSSSAVSNFPFSCVVHLHSPTSRYFLSIDSAITSISICSGLLFSFSTVPHQRLAVSYMLFVFAVQLCVSLLARVSKSLSRVSFVVILSVFVAICVASIYYLMEVESLPSVLETIRSNSVVFFILGGLLYVVYYIFTSLTIRRSMYGMYEGESGKIGSRMADVGLLRRTPILRIYLLALFRCKSHFYMLIICVIMLVASLLDISVFSTPQMKVFIMSLFVCGPAASFSLYAQIMSTSAEGLSVCGLNTWKQLLWITFVCHVLWSLFATALLMFLTSEYMLCLYIYLISIGSVFYVISGGNVYVKGRFDIFEQQGLGKQDFKFSVRYMGALYLIPMIWSIFYSSMASGTVSPQAFTIFSLLLSVPFIIFTKVGINRHAKVFRCNKYSYLKSVRR